MSALCRCEHPVHVAQCPAPDGCWCDTYAQSAPSGDLSILREYSCGCIIYLDAARQEVNERGIFCGHNSWPKHRSALLKGQETQPSLFSAGQQQVAYEGGFVGYVMRFSGCIEWQGSRDVHGYGRLRRDGKLQRAHRVIWADIHGPIPDGLLVLHTCDNPPCISLGHLYVGTDADNMRDRDNRRRQWNMKKTHCKAGHSLSGDNLYIKPDGNRACKACNRRRDREYHLRKRNQ